jgi:small-conductance mechanosensitive channel
MMQGGLPSVVADLLARLSIPESIAGPVAPAVVFVGVAILVYLLAGLTVLPLVRRALTARDVDAHARRPLLKLTKGAVVFAAITIAFGLAEFGNFLQSLATIAAAATLAIGLAMQDVMQNFVAGIFIFTDRSFRIGDWIEWDDNSGIVEDISLRVTRVRTFDNELLTVPNSELTDEVIKNPVAFENLRLKVTFGIGYDDDVDEAMEIILDEARAHDGVMDDPEPSVRLVELGDSSVGLQSRIWIATPSRSDVVKVRGEYVQAVKERFDEAGINIPYPNRTLGGELQVGDLEALGDGAE